MWLEYELLNSHSCPASFASVQVTATNRNPVLGAINSSSHVEFELRVVLKTAAIRDSLLELPGLWGKGRVTYKTYDELKDYYQTKSSHMRTKPYAPDFGPCLL